MNDSIEKLKHVLKMNSDVMTSTGVSYIEEVIKEFDQLSAQVNEMREAYSQRLYTMTNEDVDAVFNKAPEQSLDDFKARVINNLAKDIATEFYYHWHNSSGTNTAQGFDDWWKLQLFMPCKP